MNIRLVRTNDIVSWHEDLQTFGIRKNGETIARFNVDSCAGSSKQVGARMDECRVTREISN